MSPKYDLELTKPLIKIVWVYNQISHLYMIRFMPLFLRLFRLNDKGSPSSRSYASSFFDFDFDKIKPPSNDMV